MKKIKMCSVFMRAVYNILVCTAEYTQQVKSTYRLNEEYASVSLHLRELGHQYHQRATYLKKKRVREREEEKEGEEECVNDRNRERQRKNRKIRR